MCATEISARHTARSSARPGTFLALLLAFSLGAAAQQAPSREQEQIRRLRQQVQQLQSELATAQQATQTARADADKRTSQAQAEATRVRRSASATAERLKELDERVLTLTGERDTLQGQLATAQAGLESTRAELARARAQSGADTMRVERREAELSTLQQRFTSQNAALELCSRHNQSLRSVSLELLDRWQRADWRDLVAAREPFVQSSRVRLENLVQGYEEQIDRASLAAPTPAAAGRP